VGSQPRGTREAFSVPTDDSGQRDGKRSTTQ
jgi:hypothetical protein